MFETTDAHLSVNGDELYIIGVLDENVTTGEVEVDVSLMAEGDSLRLRSHSGVVGFEGKVTLNGDSIAILTSGEETEVEPATAIRLSAEQITLLRRLPGLVDRILGLVRATAVAIEPD